MAGDPVRIDLRDPSVACICLVCGAGYGDVVESCTSCGAAPPASRNDLLDRLQRSVPGQDRERLLELVLTPILDLKDRVELDSVREGLQRQGHPYAAIDEDGRLLDPGSERAAGLLAEDDPRHADRSVRLITLSDPYEMNVIPGCLEEAGIPYSLQRFTSQIPVNVGRLALAHIYVAESDRQRAEQAIASAETRVADTEPDDMQDLRLKRRFRIARLFVYLTGLAYLLSAPLAFGHHVLDGAATLAAALAFLVLAWWSRHQPEVAFGVGFILVVAVAIVAMLLDRPLLVLPGLGTLLAVFFAYEASVKASKAAGG